MASASDSRCRLTFHGVRGTAPAFDRDGWSYGGNTTCLEAVLAPDHRLLIDCGTGLRAVERALAGARPAEGMRFDVLLTHYHMDHLMGLPAFKPLYEPGNSFNFHGVGYGGDDLRTTLERFLAPPWFPLCLSDTASDKRYIDLGDSQFEIGGLRITHGRLNHPQGVSAYRLQGELRSLLFATDCERGDRACDAEFSALGAGVDILIHDAQYTVREYEERCRGWGHSTWVHAVEAALELGAGRLLLFHHDPDRSDEELDAIVESAKIRFPAAEAARESMTLEL